MKPCPWPSTSAPIYVTNLQNAVILQDFHSHTTEQIKAWTELNNENFVTVPIQLAEVY